MSKVIMITGATSGLGLALSKLFLEQGYKVHGISLTQNNWELARIETNNNPNFILHQTNISIEDNVNTLIQSILKDDSAIDILINNAGYVNPLTRLEDLSLEEFQKNIDGNLFSCFLMCKLLLPALKKQTNSLIINISSMAGKRGVPKISAYSAAKFGVIALSQCIAKENEGTGIKCITVCPGGINTPMRASLFGQEDADKQQSPDYVASVINDIIEGKIKVESGGDIIIRHGKITAINSCPTA